MKYSQLEYHLSQPRLERFLRASGNSKSKAQKLYRVNLRVSQAFYPVIHLFEVFLRNTVHYQISNYFSDPNWIKTEKAGFMSDPSLRPSNYFLKRSVQKAEKKIRRQGEPVTSGKLIAEQSMGFWTSLFDTHHYRLIGGSPIHCFANKPPSTNRKEVNKKLNRVRKLRNRIYHNEPICFRQNSIDFTNAHSVKTDIFELLEWIDPALLKYTNYFNAIQNKIDAAHHI